ncbi:hypothetical protein [Catellatospora vulcania]|uniref:hypothetical protein n=1 Tax=Catellatospora vulcania TaxID=1460450 RepID=UPI0012D48360|nr:hypothetical protein [Catellatospora vulcania]
MTSTRITATAAALLLAATLSACAGQQVGVGSPPTLDGPGTPGCGLPRPTPSAIETAGATMWPTSVTLDEALGRIMQAGEGRFGKQFAGTEVVPEKGYAIVYRVPSAEFDEFVTQQAGDECIYLRDAAFDQATLRALADRVIDDAAHWRKQGITINMTGAAHDGSGITVGVAKADLERARAELPERYGTQIPIIIEEQAGITTW